MHRLLLFSICLFVHLSVFPYVGIFNCLSLHLFICPFDRLSSYLSVRLSVLISVFWPLLNYDSCFSPRVVLEVNSMFSLVGFFPIIFLDIQQFCNPLSYKEGMEVIGSWATAKSSQNLICQQI